MQTESKNKFKINIFLLFQYSMSCWLTMQIDDIHLQKLKKSIRTMKTSGRKKWKILFFDTQQRRIALLSRRQPHNPHILHNSLNLRQLSMSRTYNVHTSSTAIRYTTSRVNEIHI